MNKTKSMHATPVNPIMNSSRTKIIEVKKPSAMSRQFTPNASTSQRMTKPLGLTQSSSLNTLQYSRSTSPIKSRPQKPFQQPEKKHTHTLSSASSNTSDTLSSTQVSLVANVLESSNLRHAYGKQPLTIFQDNAFEIESRQRGEFNGPTRESALYNGGWGSDGF
jgi:hypothetical protein